MIKRSIKEYNLKEETQHNIIIWLVGTSVICELSNKNMVGDLFVLHKFLVYKHIILQPLYTMSLKQLLKLIYSKILICVKLYIQVNCALSICSFGFLYLAFIFEDQFFAIFQDLESLKQPLKLNLIKMANPCVTLYPG